jgi:hypothetical protein
MDTKITFWEGFLGCCLVHVSVSSGAFLASLGDIARPAPFRYRIQPRRIRGLRQRKCEDAARSRAVTFTDSAIDTISMIEKDLGA